MAILAEKYFSAIVSCQVHKSVSVIKNKLTEEQMRMFKTTPFGPLLDVDLVFNGQHFHHFLLREVTDANLDVISFNILGKKDLNDKDSSCKDVENAFEKSTFINDEDAVKVALTLFIKMVMIGKDKKIQFDVKTFGVVNDPEVFRHYDWSAIFFKRTLNSMKTIMHGKKEAHETKKVENAHYASYYRIEGFVLAFELCSFISISL
ncbi:uncharacterized protein LOC120090683 [Benincasa hispida]|uniref:uncharacterized protein LOC120090683 n=1 Tax=Benincasa hispida TaxID=102211 RepID=UPI00190066F0|nr:uncharacterized protein LOC120090683 [Benincasa hispida]